MATDAITARLDALESRLRELEDREAIRDVLHLYARGADRCDLELFKSCYWPDGTDCHGFYNGNAHDFAEYVIPLLKQIRASQHSITNPIIRFDGDRAFVESQWYVMHRIPLDDGRVVDQQCEGRYLDVFEKRNGEWKILHRTFAAEAMREHAQQDLTIDMPIAQPAVARRAPDDLSYLGFGILGLEVVPIGGADLWGDARARHAARA